MQQIMTPELQQDADSGTEAAHQFAMDHCCTAQMFQDTDWPFVAGAGRCYYVHWLASSSLELPGGPIRRLMAASHQPVATTPGG